MAFAPIVVSNNSANMMTAAAARSRRVAECQTVFADYNAPQANVTEMREYALCVDSVHGLLLGLLVAIMRNAIFN